MKKYKKIIFVTLFVLVVVLFAKFFFYKDNIWHFEKDGYTMDIVMYKNILGEKKGSYCFYDNGKFNCPFSQKKEGEWDRKKINIKEKEKEFFVYNNRKLSQPAIVSITENKNILLWKLNKEKTKEYFNIPFNIKLLLFKE